MELLLDVIPFVAQEDCFVMHGGTAINLFVRNMPRLSVDFDLTYSKVQDRETSLFEINLALKRLKSRIERTLGLAVQHLEDKHKLIVASFNAQIKIEVNPVGRGLIAPPQKLSLCHKAQTEFNRFVEVNVVATGQLYGGKICAALDRQHPRDLFDVKYLLKNDGFTNEVKHGFLYCLLSTSAPINEVLLPNLLDQRKTLENQFEGMSTENFSYTDFLKTRDSLLKIINDQLTLEDRKFLFDVKNLTPNWNIYQFGDFPSIKWKLQNLKKLKSENNKKYEKQLNLLKIKLGL